MNKKNLAIIAATVIPVIMILSLMSYIYIPKLFLGQSKNIQFIYLSPDDNRESLRYQVVDNALVKKSSTHSDSYRKLLARKSIEKPQLYIYNSETNSSKKIKSNKAKQLLLSSKSISPNGFSLSCSIQKPNIIELALGPVTNCNQGRFLVGPGVTKKMNLTLKEIGADSFRFIAWVII